MSEQSIAGLIAELREASDFYARERPCASLCHSQYELGSNEGMAIAKRFDRAALQPKVETP